MPMPPDRRPSAVTRLPRFIGGRPARPLDSNVVLPALLAGLLLAAGAATAQDCVDYGEYLRPLGVIAGGGTDVDVSGDFAYATSSSTLRVLDLSDPLRPFWRGSAPITHWPRGVAVSGQVAYVVEQPYASLLHAIDVSDPDNPFVISTAPISGWCQAVAVSGDLAFTLCQGLKVFDVSDPSAMVLLDYLYNLYDANAIAVQGDLVAVASSQFDDYGHLHLIDVANPADIRLIRMLHLPGAGYAVALHGQYAYVGGRVYPPSLGRLFIVDISVPQQPALAAEIALPSVARAVSVKDDALYVIDDARQLTTYKITDPVAPELIGQVLLDGTGKKVAFAGNIGVAAAGGVRIFTASSAASPPIIGQAVASGAAVDVDGIGDVAYLACGEAGLFVADVSRADEPTIKGALVRGSFTVVRAIPGAALAADNDAEAGTGKLVAVDVAVMDRPVAIGTFDAGGEVSGLAVAGDHAYVVSADENLRILDISDRRELRLVGQLDLGHDGGDVCLAAGQAFIASATAGLRIVDVSDPLRPRPRGAVALAGCAARAVAVSGAHAFVVGIGSSANMYVVDIRDPDAPAIVTSTKLQGSPRAAVVENDVLHVAGEYGGLILVDVSDPTRPVSVGARSFAGPANVVRVVDRRLIVAGGVAGLLILPSQCAEADPPVSAAGEVTVAGLLGISPNPFNPRTTISFTLTERGRVCVDVLDARGHRQALIVDDVLDAGEHQREWNGSDRSGRRLPSGSYLCRLSTPGGTWTSKLLLLR